MVRDNYEIRGSDKSKKAFGSVRRGLSGLKGGFVGLAGAASVLAGAAALGAVVKSSLTTGDALAKTADRLGFTVKGLQALQFAGGITGVAVGTLNKGVQAMVRNLGDAEKGLGPAKIALDDLGLSAGELNRKAPEEQFRILADSIGGLTTKAEQNAVAFAIFGRAGADLVNTLSLGRDGLDEMAQEAEDLGLNLSRVDAAKIEQANDSVAKAKSIFQGLGLVFTSRVSPALTALVDLFTDFGKEGKDGFASLMPSAETFIGVIGFIGDTFRGMQIIFKTVSIVIQAEFLVITAAVEAAVNGWIELFNLIPGVEIEPPQFLKSLRETAQEELKGMAMDLKDLAGQTAFSDQLTARFNAIEASAVAAAGAVAKVQEAQTVLAPPPITEEDPEDKRQRIKEEKAAERRAAAIERLRMDLLTEEEALAESFMRKEELLNISLANQEISETEFLQRLQAVRGQQAKEQQGLEDRQNKEKKQKEDKFKDQAIDGFWALAAQAEKSSKAGFVAVKAVRIAQAVVSTFTAATNALAEVPYPANIAVAAGIIAGGLANVATIAATNPGSGGGGGGAPSVGGAGGTSTKPAVGALEEPQGPGQLGPAATTQEFRPVQEVTVLLEGSPDGRMETSRVRELIEQINEVTDDGVVLKVGTGGEG